jgi:hypothetical protein
MTGFSPYVINQFWPTWTEAVTEAGLTPNVLNQQIPEENLLQVLAELTRRIGKMPTFDRLLHESRNNPDFPSPSTFKNRFGSMIEVAVALKEWATTRPEYSDVATLLGILPEKQTRTTSPSEATSVLTENELSDSYLPPVVASLEALSRGDDAIVEACKKLGRDENSEFERRVGVAFEILGLTVEPMGQGYGRVADGIARCKPGGWAIIYDAKLRRDRYRLLTEDRKFREYIETHVPPLRSAGLQRCYFAIVSSQFSESDVERAHELVRLCDIKSLVFVETSALAMMVENRVRNAAAFNLDDVERLFTRTRIVTGDDVKKGR